MAALATVTDYFTDARVLLQDTVAPYRYDDPSLLSALNAAFLDASRLRPDLFMNKAVPSYSAVDTTAVDVPMQYRTAFLYYVIGRAQLRDEEVTQDARASAFLSKFTAQLLSLS